MIKDDDDNDDDDIDEVRIKTDWVSLSFTDYR